MLDIGGKGILVAVILVATLLLYSADGVVEEGGEGAYCLKTGFSEEECGDSLPLFPSFEFYIEGKHWIVDPYFSVKSTGKRGSRFKGFSNTVYLFRKSKEADVAGKSRRKGKVESVLCPGLSPAEKTKAIGAVDDIIRINGLNSKESVRGVMDAVSIRVAQEIRICALEYLLKKTPEIYRDYVRIYLAMSYVEIAGDTSRAVMILRSVEGKGGTEHLVEVAKQLIEIYRGVNAPGQKIERDEGSGRSVEEHNRYKHGGAPGGEEGKSEKEKMGMAKEKTAIGNYGMSKVEGLIYKPDAVEIIGKKEAPLYSYFEGEVFYRDLGSHKRALLYIKPSCLLVVDKVATTLPVGVEQRFFTSNGYRIEKVTDSLFAITAHDSSKCRFIYIYKCSGLYTDIGEFEGDSIDAVGNSIMDGKMESSHYCVKARADSIFLCYIVSIVVPVTENKLQKTEVRVVGERLWGPRRLVTLQLEVHSGSFLTEVRYKPSSRFIADLDIGSFNPEIEVVRKKR